MDGQQYGQQSRRAGDDAAFAALDLLSGVTARNAAALRGFDALAIGRARRWTASRAVTSRAVTSWAVTSWAATPR